MHHFLEDIETAVTVLSMIVFFFSRIYKTGQNYEMKNFVIEVT